MRVYCFGFPLYEKKYDAREDLFDLSLIGPEINTLGYYFFLKLQTHENKQGL